MADAEPLLQGSRDPVNGSKYATFDLSPQSPTHDSTAASKPKASWISHLFFSYATSMMKLGASQQLETSDLWDLETQNQADTAFAALDKAFKAHFNHASPLSRAVADFYGFDVVLWGIAALLSAGCSLLAPAVVFIVVSMFETHEFDMKALAWWLGAFFAARLFNVFLAAHMDFNLDLIALRLSAAIKALLFRKVLQRKHKLAPGYGFTSSQRQKLRSQIGTDEEIDMPKLLESDVAAISDLVRHSNSFWIVPLQVVLAAGILYWVIDVAAFAGFVVIAVSMTASYFVSNYEVKLLSTILKDCDNRNKVIKEVFAAIQAVKINAWEDKFADKVARLRADELVILKKYLLIKTTESFVIWGAPLISAIASFATFVLLSDNSLSAATAFATITLFISLRNPLQCYFEAIQASKRSVESIRNIEGFLKLPDAASNNVKNYCENVDINVAVSIKDGTFNWGSGGFARCVLHLVNLSINKGDLAVVHGGSGQGKSTLCLALLGETVKEQGHVVVRGRVAYCPQQPWVINASVRDNILFGSAFDSAKYQRVLEACGLQQDLNSFPAGDETEISHDGICSGLTLSISQKTRVSLARACYSDADIFIFDSTLDVFDAATQTEIFNKCFCSLLEHKTIILVTSNRVIMYSDVVNSVTYVSNCGLQTSTNQVKVRRNPSTDLSLSQLARIDKSVPPTSPDEHASGQLIQDEKREIGRVAKHVFWVYFKALGGFKMCALVLLTQLLWQAFQIGSDVWLTHWTNEVTDSDQEAQASKDMAIYAALAGAGAVMVFIRAISVVLVGIRGARHLFDSMTSALLKAPMRFFDANPIGRITNRYGADIMSIDVRMPLIFGGFLADFFVTVCQLTIAVATINFLGVLVIPLAWVYVRVADFYLHSSREINRMRRVSNSPVLNFVSQCEEGLDVIRAFGPGCIQHMLVENSKRLDAASKVLFTVTVTERWYIVHIQLIGCAVVMGIVSALVYLRAALSPGLVGLAFSYALSVDAGLANLVRQWSYVEMIMVSPERVMEYASIESEGQSQSLVVEQSESWPQRGTVEFDKVVFQYQDNGVAVLQSVSFAIQNKEKIGIVGRTGAGKSSLAMALFRINELTSGRIVIDGVDTATLPLKTLRSRVSIIPQSPVLFEGSLRAYMDPFDDYTDAQIWESIEKVDMKSTVAALDGQLLFQIVGNGDNLSVGERQLLCMARALLSRSRVVVMDEATASIDHATERKLQKMIARDFEDATVLTIAHRLATVLSSDRVLVMNNGQVVEFDSPAKLVKNHSGVFHQLVKEAGYLDKVPQDE